MPIGLALLLLAVVRLCQSSPLLASMLVELRPRRAWGVGLVGLATVWSLAAACIAQWLVGQRDDSADQRPLVSWRGVGREHRQLACRVEPARTLRVG